MIERTVAAKKLRPVARPSDLLAGEVCEGNTMPELGPPGVAREYRSGLRIDLGGSHELCAFSYLPRQDGGSNGTIKNYEFAVSANGNDWTTVTSGVLVSSAANLSERTVIFGRTTGRYIRLKAFNEVNGGPWTTAAEIRVKGAVIGVNHPPVATLRGR